MKKRLLALFLILTMLASMLSTIAVATDSDSGLEVHVSGTEDLPEYESYGSSDVAVEGTNSFGELLAQEMNDQQEIDDGYFNGFEIKDVKIYGMYAYVELEAIDTCTLVLGLYNDEGTKLLAYGTRTVSGGTSYAEMYISSDEELTHYLVKAFLVEEATMQPLCSVYTNTLYTEAMQIVANMSADDFEEDRVLNLDEDMDKNFAVYSEETIVIDAENENQNVVVSANYETDEYVIENADEQMLALKPGDVFAYPYSEEDVLIVKIATISISGTTVTITGAEVDMETVFDYVKIDADADMGDVEIDPSTADEGVDYLGLEEDEDSEMQAIEGESSSKITASYTLDKSIESETTGSNVKVSGKLSFSITAKTKCYINGASSYIKVSVEDELKLKGSVEGEIKFLNAKLGTYVITPAPGISLNVKPAFVLSASCKASVSVKTTSSLGIQADVVTGIHWDKPKSETEFEWEFEGSVFIGVKVPIELGFINPNIAKVEVSGTIGPEIKATPVSDDKHTCNECLDGEVKLKSELKAEAKFLNHWGIEGKKSFEIKVADFYYSIDHHEFGLGECPYTLELHGNCGKTITYDLDLTSGVLTLTGRGAMYDYQDPSLTFMQIFPDQVALSGRKLTPWFPYKDQIKSIEIDKNITKLGNSAFTGCVAVEKVTIPNSVSYMGYDVFADCTSLTTVQMPTNLQVLEREAFLGCKKLNTISVPTKVACIGYRAFAGCTSLTAITIPKSVEMSGWEMFVGCSNLESLIIEGTIDIDLYSCPKLQSIGGIGSGANVQCGWTAEIPNGAFSYSPYITKVMIPSGVQKIGDYAFSECENLTSVTIPSSVTEIGVHAFENTAWLNNLGGQTIINGIPIGGSYDEDLSMQSIEQTGQETISGETTEYTAETLEANREYLLVVSKSNRVTELLDDGNLLYLDQRTSDSDGNIQFTYNTISGTAYTAILFGPSLGNVDVDFEVDSEPEPEPEPPTVNFVDVNPSEYYAPAVNWAVANNITAGTTPSTFSPDDTCTRGQVVAFLWRAAGRPEPETENNPFTDVKTSDYFYKAVLWASENGIVYGTSSTTFSPNQGCTRGQVAAFLWRAAGRPEPTTDNNPFTDVKASEYYGKAVIWAAENKIVYGTSATQFSPEQSCTRAQIVTFLYRTYGK